jgi:hypothetical protein
MTGDRCGHPVAEALIGDARCATDEQASTSDATLSPRWASLRNGTTSTTAW